MNSILIEVTLEDILLGVPCRTPIEIAIRRKLPQFVALEVQTELIRATDESGEELFARLPITAIHANAQFQLGYAIEPFSFSIRKPE